MANRRKGDEFGLGSALDGIAARDVARASQGADAVASRAFEAALGRRNARRRALAAMVMGTAAAAALAATLLFGAAPEAGTVDPLVATWYHAEPGDFLAYAPHEGDKSGNNVIIESDSIDGATRSYVDLLYSEADAWSIGELSGIVEVP
jgi:hypothetical protein